MPYTPFRVRILQNAPPWLTDGCGERLLFGFGLAIDGNQERKFQGLFGHLPLNAPLDALTVLAGDRLITPGLTEGLASLRRRVQIAFDTWQRAGLARAPLSQLLGFLLEKTPRVISVATRYEPDPARTAYAASLGIIPSDPMPAYPPDRDDTQWDVYPVARDPNAEPVHAVGTSGGDGDWDWDSLSQVTGSWLWNDGYIVIDSVPGQQWTTPQAWTWDTCPFATWDDVTGCWDAAADFNIIATIRAIVKLWKPANVVIRTIIINYDAAQFDPNEPAGLGVNPDGYFGDWARIVAGEWVATRFADAGYLEEVT